MEAGRRWWTHLVRGSEGGFGLLEIVIASGVMLTALTSMAYVATNSFYDIAGARQRQTALGLLDETIEQVRALPYGIVRDGVRTSDLAGDPRVLGLGTAASPYTLATTGERLVHSPNNVTVAPIVPNVSSRTVDGVVYAVRVYVSEFANDINLGATITGYVDWTSAGRGHRPTFVRATTVVFLPAGADTLPPSGIGWPCQLDVVHPYAGPCPATMAAVASAAQGHLRVSSSGSVGPALASASTDTASADSSTKVAQVDLIDGTAKGSGVTLLSVPAGFPTTVVVADDSPDTPGTTDYASDSRTGLPPAASGPAGVGTMSVSSTSADTVEGASAAAAGVPATSVCKNPAGASQTDGLPCQRSVANQAGTLRTTFDLAPIGLGSLGVAELLPPPSPITAYTKHVKAACAVASSVGCVHAEVSRAIGRFRIGAVPSAIGAPLGFGAYLVELDNYADSVSAEAGIGAATSNATVTSGTFKYWNGLTYTSIALTASSTFSVTTANVTTSLGLYSLTVSSTFKKGPLYQPSPVSGTCLGLACITSSEVLLGSPLIGTTTYTVKLGGVTVNQLTLTTDFGDLHVKATYT